MFSYAEPMTTEAQEGSPGEAVRQLRIGRGVSLRELARRIEVSPATVSAIENGKTGLKVDRLHQIAEALGVNASSLVSNTSHAPIPRPVAGAVRTNTDWRAFPALAIDPVLQAAIDAFVAVGYHGASMRTVARLCNMGVSSVYHHYENKQELLFAILTVTMDDLVWRMQAARDEGSDPIERIRFLTTALALYHTRRIELSFIGASEMRSLSPAGRSRIVADRDLVQAIFETEVAAAIAAGQAHVPEPKTPSRAIVTMCTALASWFRPGGRSTPEQIADEYAEIALRVVDATR